MAILGSIRKRPLFLILIIGLAIFAFILADGINSDNGSTSVIGSINGKDINGEVFSKRIDAQKNRNQNASSMQNVNTVWDAFVREKIYEDQIEKSGIIIGENDIWDAMINNPTYQNSPNFKNDEGLFDENKLKEFIATMKSTPEGKLNWLNAEKNIIKSIKQISYNDLIKAGLTASLKEGQQFYNYENTSADIQFVYEPYNTISDSIVKVSDAEVTAYIKENADQFKVEASREIEYVNFEIKPSEEDITLVKKELTKLKNDFTEYNSKAKKDETIIGFTNTEDNIGFVTEYSDISYLDKIYFTKDLATGVYDSVSKLPKGSVYGPYVEGGYYKLIKFVADKEEKSVKPSHILIAYEGSERAKESVKRTKEEAEKQAKIVLKKITKNNFADLAKEYSDGPSGSKGGDLGGWKKKGSFVKTFDDFVFTAKKDEVGLVETNFGYHLIKINDIKTEAGLNLAIVSRKIDPSENTVNNIYQQAETLATDLISGKDILELAKTGNYAIKKASNLTNLSENIIGLGNQRDIVKWSFENDTNNGDVKRFDLENSFVIVQLKNKYKKGLMSLAVAKPKVLPTLEKAKKIKLIKTKMVGNTLDEIAKSVGKTINTANNVSATKPNLKVSGNDENVVGALLYMNEGDLKVIDGKSGVYAVKIIKKIPAHDIKKYDTYSKNITTQLKTKTAQIYNSIKEGAEIEDQRASFY
ncbi:MAG: peptidylprolyl isomerase [Flavobacteriaceae bacterium]|nr:peptidylprolyl isomerase [Flavobacteriaceae bacterium]